jgi:RHS repeat-associated protein
VEYANTGTAAMPAPILTVQSGDADNSDKPLLTLDKNSVPKVMWSPVIPKGLANAVQIFASGAVPGILQPGERIQIPVYCAGLQQPWTMSDTEIELQIIAREAGDTTPIDWNVLETTIRPDWISDSAWPLVFATLQQQIGHTWGDYVNHLASDAAYLSRFGLSVKDVSALFAFEVRKAMALDFIGVLAEAVDVDVPVPGLELTFRRTFGSTINERNYLGPLGLGWSAPWFTYLEKQTDGTIIIHETADNFRKFVPDSRKNGHYFGETGDPGLLEIQAGGVFKLSEPNGFITWFHADGKLQYYRDTNANFITPAYTGDQLTSVTHTAGGQVQFTYNSAGRIESVVGSTGWTTTYSYDSTNTHLISSTSPAGTTFYTYFDDLIPAKHNAIKSITEPGGRVTNFEYDDLGRLVKASLGGDIYPISYSYSPEGAITEFDGTGKYVKNFFDHRGLIVRSENNLGDYVIYKYNALTQLTDVKDSTGRSMRIVHSLEGRLKSIIDPYGRAIITFNLGGPHNEPTSFFDANGNTTTYLLDVKGNIRKVTASDGTIQDISYDDHGTIDNTINARGQLIERTLNDAGQVTHESRADGTIADYNYDSRSRLTSIVSPEGTTSLTYDLADRLTRITYPNGRWLHYTYDAAGRRIRLEGSDGFRTNYVYDVSSHLIEIRDGDNNPIVSYEYDAAGRLHKETKRNGTYSIFGLDAIGRTESILNYAADATVNSKFLYTYDPQGRPSTLTTLDGTWTYTYDLNNQLTHASFVAMNSTIPNQDLAYEYDSLGNRTRSILNGDVTNYVPNNMNQYSSINGSELNYDDDGNLTVQAVGGSTTTYSYDILNRLSKVVTSEGVWKYEYDFFGNRSAVIANGVRTEYLVDPTGLSQVVSEYDGNGNRTAGFVHGPGFLGRTGSDGWAYYDFDGLGSTAGISTGAGNYVNRYAYGPWGESLLATESVANSFEYVGLQGVMNEGNGLQFMRARYYSADVGRFISPDPLGLTSGDVNYYRYVGNHPTNAVDPSGLSFWWWLDNPGAKWLHNAASGSGANVGVGADADLAGSLVSGALDVKGLPGASAAAGYALDANNAENLGNGVAGLVRAHNCGGAGNFATTQEFNSIPELRSLSCDNGRKPPTRRTGGDFTPGIWDCVWWLPGANKCDSSATSKSRAVGGKDPNEKTGIAGYGPQHFIAPNQPIVYRVDFENLGKGSLPKPVSPATAPAQRVDVSDQLTSNLDWNSFYFTEFGFGDKLVHFDDRRTHQFTTLEMSYNQQVFNVEVELSFDSTTGLVTAAYQSVDPTNGLPPDVMTGFLPPEDGTDIGKAHFSYSVTPKPGLASGTQLRNIALISFDGQPIIPTNQIDPEDPSKGFSPDREALNTIDAVAPTSSVLPLPNVIRQSRTSISWSGVDDAAGSGVDFYDVFVSDNGGLYQLLFGKTTQTSLEFVGLSGHSYSFYSLATDHVGLRQPVPLAANASTVFQYAPPTDIQITNSSMVENALPNSLIGSLSTADPDPAVDFSYSFAVGSGDVDNASFKLVGNQLFSNATFNYETKPQYSIRVRTTDQDGLFFEKILAISIVDVNEPPVLSTDNAIVVGDVLTPIVNSGTWSDPELGNVTLISSLGSITKNANGTWQWSYTPSGKLTNQNVIVTADDGQYTPFISFTVSSLVNIPNSKVYYLGSSFSQGGNNVNAALDGTKVLAKSGLVPQTLGYTNLINTTRGINGLVLDIAGLVASNLTVADFVFRMSPTGLFNEAANPPQSWQVAPAPTNIVVTPGNATTPARVRLEWPDNSIANRWLQIQVVADANTGLTSTQVYYVGHLQGEVNGQITGGAFFVTTQDQSAVLPLGLATVGVPRDLDKNGFVTTQDLTAVRNSITAGRTLRVITIPASGSVNEGALLGSGGGNALAGDDRTFTLSQSESSLLSSTQFAMPNIPVTMNRNLDFSAVNQMSSNLNAIPSALTIVEVGNQIAGSRRLATECPTTGSVFVLPELKKRSKQEQTLEQRLSPLLVDLDVFGPREVHNDLLSHFDSILGPGNGKPQITQMLADRILKILSSALI